MPARKRSSRRGGQVVQSAAAVARDRTQETIRLINAALDGEQDIPQLRKLAAVRGLVNTELRARLWPRLLGTDGGGAAAVAASGAAAQAARPPVTAAAAAAAAAGDGHEQYREWAAGSHKDTSTVRVDVERSLHSFASFLGSEERAARRQELTRLLNAVVVKHAGSVHYYQGLHDVASVLLLVGGEAPAFTMLCRLSTGHLRDATRPSLDPVIELLGLMAPILEAADPQLAAFVEAQGLPPFYALSWFITWFAHDLGDFGEVCRLFDLFLSTHPLMPLYVGAVAMASQRAALLAADEMPVLHSKLVNMRITKRASADQLAVQAIELYKRAQPERLIAARALALQQCVAPRVTLRSGVWLYPEPRAAAPGLWSQQRLQGLVAAMLRLPGSPAQRRRLVMASLTGVLGSLYVVAMCYVVRSGGGSAALPLSLLYNSKL